MAWDDTDDPLSILRARSSRPSSASTLDDDDPLSILKKKKKPTDDLLKPLPAGMVEPPPADQPDRVLTPADASSTGTRAQVVEGPHGEQITDTRGRRAAREVAGFKQGMSDDILARRQERKVASDSQVIADLNLFKPVPAGSATTDTPLTIQPKAWREPHDGAVADATAVSESGRAASEAMLANRDMVESGDYNVSHLRDAAKRAQATARARAEAGDTGAAEELADQAARLDRLASAYERSDTFGAVARDAALLNVGNDDDRWSIANLPGTIDTKFLASQGITDPDGKPLAVSRGLSASRDFAAPAVGFVAPQAGLSVAGRLGLRALRAGMAGTRFAESGAGRLATKAIDVAETNLATDRAGSFLERTKTRLTRGAVVGQGTGAASDYNLARAEGATVPEAVLRAAVTTGIGAGAGAAIEAVAGAAIDPVRKIAGAWEKHIDDLAAGVKSRRAVRAALDIRTPEERAAGLLNTLRTEARQSAKNPTPLPGEPAPTPHASVAREFAEAAVKNPAAVHTAAVLPFLDDDDPDPKASALIVAGLVAGTLKWDTPPAHFNTAGGRMAWESYRDKARAFIQQVIKPAVGETVVKDPDGDPIRLYHGTHTPFPGKLDPSTGGGRLGDGVYFTDTPSTADGYAVDYGMKSLDDAHAAGMVPRTYFSYLRAKKVLDLDRLYSVAEIKKSDPKLFDALHSLMKNDPAIEFVSGMREGGGEVSGWDIRDALNTAFNGKRDSNDGLRDAGFDVITGEHVGGLGRTYNALRDDVIVDAADIAKNHLASGKTWDDVDLKRASRTARRAKMQTEMREAGSDGLHAAAIVPFLADDDDDPKTTALIAGAMLAGTVSWRPGDYSETLTREFSSLFGTNEARAMHLAQKAYDAMTRFLSTVVRPAIGDSAIADRDGIPIRVYHGSPRAPQGRLDPKRAVVGWQTINDGTFFTDTPSSTLPYTDPRGPAIRTLVSEDEAAPTVTYAYLRSKKVLDMDKHYSVLELSREDPDLWKALDQAADALPGDDFVLQMRSDDPNAAIYGHEIQQALSSPEYLAEIGMREARPNDMLRQLGYNVLTGLNIGEPGRTYISLVEDAIVEPGDLIANAAKSFSDFVDAPARKAGLVAGLAMIAMGAQEAEAQGMSDDPMEILRRKQGKNGPNSPTPAPEAPDPRDPAATFAAGAAVVAAATLTASMARRGYGVVLRDITRGTARGISPGALAAMGYAMTTVPDEDYGDFGKTVMGLAALKAIGSERMAFAGGKVGKTILASAKSWGAEGVIRMVSPEALLSPEVNAALKQFRQTVAKGRARALELGTALGKASPAANRLVTDVLRGETWESNYSPDDARAALALAIQVQQNMAELGRSKLSASVITPEQFGASGGDNYLPRLYAHHEAERVNPTGLKGAGGGDANRVRVGQQKSRVLDIPVREAAAELRDAKDALADAMAKGDAALTTSATTRVQKADGALKDAVAFRDQERQKLGEIREASYLSSYALEKGYRDVAAATLLATVRDVPDAVHPDWIDAFDSFMRAKQDYEAALDAPAREALRSDLESAQFRVEAAQKKIADLATKRYMNEPEGSKLKMKEQSMAMAELDAANSERLDLQKQLQAAGSKPDRAAAKAAMDAAKLEMANISRQFQAERGLFGGAGDYVTMPNSQGMGALAGAVVQREIAMALDGLPEVKVIGRMMRTWKQIKTIFNPGTHVGNIMSNSVMLHMSGLPMTRQPKWLIGAARDMKAYGGATKTLSELGVLGVNSITEPDEGATRGVYGPKLKDLLALRETTRPETKSVLVARGVLTLGERLRDKGHDLAAKVVEAADRMDGATHKPDGSSWTTYEGVGVRRFGKDAKRLYENEDNLFRVAAYMQAIAKPEDGGRGLSHAEALRIAQNDLIDFHSRSPLLSVARQTVAPFILYPAKAIPVFARQVIDHPERWIVAASTLLMLNEIAQAQADYELSDADVPQRERKSGMGALVPDLVQVPFGRNATGGVPAMDFTRWTPMSAATTGAPPGTTAGQLGLPGLLAGSGPWFDVANLLNNRDSWTGKPIIGPEDDKTSLRTVGKIATKVADIGLPSALGMQRRRLMEGVAREDDQATAQNLLGLSGLRPRYFQPGEGTRRDVMDVREAIRGVKQETGQNIRKSNSPEYNRDKLQDARDRTNRILKNFRERQRKQR